MSKDRLLRDVEIKYPQNHKDTFAVTEETTIKKRLPKTGGE